MSMSTTYGNVGLSKKTYAVLALATAMLLVAGVAYFSGVKNAGAVAPSDYGLTEGNTVSAAGSSDPDVYIINSWGYKRLFISPAIFNMYGHLGGFAKVKNVTPAVRDAFSTSGLFRDCQVGSVNNNGNVYALEVTSLGGFNGLAGVGVLHWVNVTGSQAVTQDPNFFNKVFCVNDKEFASYNQSAAFTSLSQVPVYSRAGVVVNPSGSPVPVSGPVTAMLATTNPGAATLTTKANGVTYMKVALSGSGTVSSVRVVRSGPGKTGDFANVYLYDGAKRLTSGRTPSSSDGSVTFSGLNYVVNGSATLSVVADMSSSGATAGDVNYFTIGASDITLTGGTAIGGSFPLVSSNMTVSGQTGGTITIDKSGSLTNPNVGQTGIEVAEFKLTANTEGAKISRVQLIQGGTIKNADLTNLKISVSGVTLATSPVMTSNGYAVFDLSSNPYVIAKGDNRIFQVFGDVAGKKADTINLYVEVTADILAVGDQFGFGMSVANGTYTVGSSSTGPTTLTLQGGVLTLSFVGPSATNVTTTQTKVHLLDFNLNAASNVDIRKTGIILCNDYTGAGNYTGAVPTASLSAGFTDLNNVQIIDRVTGTAYVGPQDGTAFTVAGNDATIGGDTAACGTSDNGYGKQFTDSFSMKAGETKQLAIVADIKTSNTGNNLKSGSIFKALLGGYGTLVGAAGDLTILKYSDSNTGPFSVDVVPSANMGGNNMTVQGSSLTVALSANPASGNRSFVKGTNTVNVNGLTFTAARGNPVTVTALTLQGYAFSTAAGGLTTGNPGALISAIRIIDGDTGAVISSTPSSNNLSLTSGSGSGKVTFSNLSWVIPSGATKNLIAQVDLSTNTPPTNNIMSFDLAATTDITALDGSSNTVNASNSGVNGTGNATTYITVASAGSLVTANAADTPTSAAVYWNQAGAPFSKFRFTSTNEGFYLEKLNFVGSSATTLNNNVDNVTISYLNKAGQTLTTTGTFNNNGSVSFGYSAGTPDNRPYVPKDGSMYVTVTSNIKSAASLFRASGSNFSINLDGGTYTDTFRAVGDGSGTVLTGTSSGIATRTPNVMYTHRSYPQFTMLTPPATTIAIGQDVFKFKIDALGSAADSATVFFDGATALASGSVKFAVIASGAMTSTLGFDLRRVVDASGATVDQLVASASGVAAPQNLNHLTGAATGNIGSASFRFQDVAANQSIEIPAGQSNTFVLRLNTVTGYSKPYNSTSGRAADFLQIILKGSEATTIRWTDKGGVSRNASLSSVANILKNLPMNGPRINFN